MTSAWGFGVGPSRMARYQRSDVGNQRSATAKAKDLPLRLGVGPSRSLSYQNVILENKAFYNPS